MDAAIPARLQIDANLDGPVLRKILRRWLTELAQQVDSTRRDAAFHDALQAMRRFWRYSPFNEFVILLQRPDASRVASRKVWESLGRRVKPGERPMGVFAPTRWRRGWASRWSTRTRVNDAPACRWAAES